MVEWLVFIAIYSVLAALLLPFYPSDWTVWWNKRCQGKLEDLAQAIHHFHEVHGSFPLAHTMVDGQPGHSWRTQVLPQAGILSDIEAKALFGSLDLSEPWDTVGNLQLFDGTMTHGLNCPLNEGNIAHDMNYPLTDSHIAHPTTYFAIVDSRTVWPPDHVCRFEDIKDGTANTILLIEAPRRNVHWYEPRDLPFDEAVELLTSIPTEDDSIGHKLYNGFLCMPSFGINVAFADGSVEFVTLPVD